MASLCEVRVFSRRHQYAGTLDVLGILHGAGALIDYKTGSPADVGAQWQTAAYLGALLQDRECGDTSEMVAFDPLRHQYTLDGVVVPSVTQILQATGIINFEGVPQPILLAARDRGAAVHQACHYYNEDDLDVAAFAAEFPHYWPYLSAWIAFRRESGFRPATSFDELGAVSHIKRYAVQLRKDGRYRVETYKAATDYSEFITLRRTVAILARHRGTPALEEVA